LARIIAESIVSSTKRYWGCLGNWTQRCWVWQRIKPDPKHFKMGLPAMGHVAWEDPRMLGLAESDPTHLKKKG